MKTALLSCGALAALVSTSALAQPTFAPQVRYSTLISSDDVEAGDLDGDGDLDLVATTEGLSVLLGDGDGTFGPVTNFSAGGTPFELALGDINNDGDLDVVTTLGTFVGQLGAALGNGDGTFAAPLVFAGGSVPNCVVLADFDEDGALDAAVGNSNAGGISLYLGNGNGTFDAAVVLSPGTSPTDVKVADVDEDGDLDLLASEADFDVNVLLGNGNGTFAAAIVASAGAFGDGMDIDLGDFDRDGNLDLVSSHGLTDQIGVLLGNGDGTFDPVTYFNAGDYPTSVIAADIDGDGMDDVVAIDQFSDRLAVLAGNGDGTFAPRLLFTAGDAPSGAVAADLDGDGDRDVAVTNSTSQDASVFLNLRAPSRVGLNGAACAFVSIADAAAAATSGDTIYASPGAYTEPTLVLSAFTLTLAGSDAACSAVTSGLVTIAPSAGRMFDLDASVLTLEGVSVLGGSIVGNGGTIYADNASTVVLDDAHVVEGTSTVNGGCIYALQSTVSMIDGSTIEDCTADGYGGGAYINLGTLTMEAGTAIRGNIAVSGAGGGAAIGGSIASIAGEISDNGAEAGGGLYGAVINATPADIELTGSALVAENSGGDGGGIYAFGSNTVVRVADSTAISDNTGENGAGVFIVAATLEVEDRATFEDNVASVDGGAIFADQSVVDLAGLFQDSISIRRNQATGKGGGIYLNNSTLTTHFASFSTNSADGGGGLWAQGGSSATLRNARFSTNTAGGTGGGGIYVVDAGTSLAVRSDFITCNPALYSRSRYCSDFILNRTTGIGGGILIIGHATADIQTTAFIANDSPLNGEAVMVYTNIGVPSQAVLRNTLFHNHVGSNAPAVGVTQSTVDIYSSTFAANAFPVAYLTGGTGVFHRNIVWANTNDSILNGISGNCNTTQTALGAPVGMNNNQLNPLFDAAHVRSPYKLLAGSPAVDACASGPANDLDGVARPINGAWDKGVFER